MSSGNNGKIMNKKSVTRYVVKLIIILLSIWNIWGAFILFFNYLILSNSYHLQQDENMLLIISIGIIVYFLCLVLFIINKANLINLFIMNFLLLLLGILTFYHVKDILLIIMLQIINIKRFELLCDAGNLQGIACLFFPFMNAIINVYYSYKYNYIVLRKRK